MAGHGGIPRAHTAPSHLCGGSPKAGARRLPSWRRPPSAAASGWGGDAGAVLSTGRSVLAATIALYLLALLSLPVLYSSFGPPRLSGGSSNLAAAGGDLHAAALAEGVLQTPEQQQQRGLMRLAAALGGRRSALERGAPADGAGAAELWPDAGRAQRLFTAATPQKPRVEYRDAGNIVSLVDALNSSLWDEPPLYYASPPPPRGVDSAGSSQPGQPAGTVGGGMAPSPLHFPAQCPQGEIRLFVGVTSRASGEEAQAKRDSIRRTWMQYARDHYPDMTVRFILAQPATEAELHASVELLGGEIQRHADIIIVPGTDVYRNLPSKTLQMLRYALSSECRYTHVMKTDDDVFLRPQMLMDIINGGQYNFSVDVQYDGSGTFDGRPAPYRQSPWMSSMYVGQLDSMKAGGIYPGWSPNRQPRSKWFLSHTDLPDEWAPLGVRWASGWGYMLSRDLAEFISNTATMYAAVPEKKPLWWGRMPWEDIMIGTMLRGVARVHHHDGFKSAWQECDRLTVLKHLDNDSPALQDGLYSQELSGLWSKKSVVCSSGVFKLGNHSDWQIWRNSLPDNQMNGFM